MMLMMSETMTTQALLQKSFVGEPEEGKDTELGRFKSLQDPMIGPCGGSRGRK
jgi:hypothetical protein